MIQLSQPQVYFGPNPYSSDPVIAVTIDLLPDEGRDLAAMADSMAKAFATWWTCPVRPAEESSALFVARFLADWSLAALNEVRGYLHAAGARELNGRVEIWLGHHDPAFSLHCLRLGAQLFSKVGRGQIAPDAIAKVMQSPEVRDRVISLGGEPFQGNAEAADKFVKAQMVEWSKLVKSGKISVD